MRNGILDISRVLANEGQCLIPHTPDFFTLSSLPFSYDPNAKSPTWIKFLKQVQPDKSVRRLLQEWFGYNLVYETNQEKMMIFEGPGANGKTVVCTALREVLGGENVSAVSLEAFDPRRTFVLTATLGKLANIVGELSEIDKAAEGLLKNIITGTEMTFERKFGAPFEAKPTVRLTWSTNQLPTFRDRSNGIWRRLICIPFRVIIPEGLQNKNLQLSSWWQSSGELAGIFNWSLKGLIRLKDRGYFKEPSVCRQYKKEYREDSNPAGAFLKSRCQESASEKIGCGQLYSQYRDFAIKNGNHPLSAMQFAREVKKEFPKVQKTQNAIALGWNERDRAWLGLSFNT